LPAAERVELILCQKERSTTSESFVDEEFEGFECGISVMMTESTKTLADVRRCLERILANQSKLNLESLCPPSATTASGATVARFLRQVSFPAQVRTALSPKSKSKSRAYAWVFIDPNEEGGYFVSDFLQQSESEICSTNGKADVENVGMKSHGSEPCSEENADGKTNQQSSSSQTTDTTELAARAKATSAHSNNQATSNFAQMPVTKQAFLFFCRIPLKDAAPGSAALDSNTNSNSCFAPNTASQVADRSAQSHTVDSSNTDPNICGSCNSDYYLSRNDAAPLNATASYHSAYQQAHASANDFVARDFTAQTQFEVGQTVMLLGLNDASLNGMVGVVHETADPATGRYLVNLFTSDRNGRLLRVRPEKMRVHVAAQED